MRKSFGKCVATMAVIAMTVSGCAKENVGPKGNVADLQNGTGETTSADVTNPSDSDNAYEEMYSEVLDRIYNNIINGTMNEDETEGAIGVWEVTNYVSRIAGLDAIGYAIQDISGDGIPELMIGIIDRMEDEKAYGNLVVAMYTLDDNRPHFVFEGWSRNSYQAAETGKFYYYGSGGYAYSAFGECEVEADGKNLKWNSFYFSDLDPMDFEKIYFYRNTTGEWNIEGSEKLDIQPEEFWALTEDISKNITDYEMIPLSKYRVRNPIGAAVEGALVQLVRIGYGKPWSDDDIVGTFYDPAVDESQTFNIVAQENVKDFKLLKVQVVSVDANGKPSFETEVMQEFGAVDKDKYLVGTLNFHGDSPEYGISYVDEWGNTHYYTIEISGKDGSYVMVEFTK